MKKLLLVIGLVLVFATAGYCEIRYIDGYSRSDGTYVSGHWRDTSGDGNPYNNANSLGYNGNRRVPEGIWGY